jgi:hypothetical protein
VYDKRQTFSALHGGGMQLISSDSYDALVDGADLVVGEVAAGRKWPKVLRLKDGSFLKLFRNKHVITSARLVPHAVRFQRNARYLEAHHIPTVRIEATFKIASLQRTAVQYWPLEGQTLRERYRNFPIDEHLAKALGRFFHRLHQKGIYFRSIHFGNIILMPDHRIGLIDLVDMSFRQGPIRTGLRVRNLRHLFRHRADIEALSSVRTAFIETYCQQALLRPRQEEYFRLCFENYFQHPYQSHD